MERALRLHGTGSVRAEITTTPARDSSQSLAPQDERILDRIGVVAGPHGCDGEPEALVQDARRLVRAADLERGPDCAHAHTLGQQVTQQRAGDAPAPDRRTDGEII